MVQFSKLRLNGFKSFVERTELDIEQGLNGVVGPNGCGKSNLVEALRWVMGENSAKRMRGGTSMEDVIFAGTSSRSARNIAEVSLLLNNEDRKAPAPYNNSDEIEVVRRIERDHGSVYKINGKTVRARDVQMLFADTVTGSNSPALVSQGRITEIIKAKPHQRRLILEESAGIAGLYARRHEAELRLKASDTNLQRLEDLLGNFEKQLSSLKRQARQAHNYKNLNAQIRQLEVTIAWLEWRRIVENSRGLEKDYTEIEKLVAERLLTVTQLTKTQNTQAEELPSLRRSEAESSAALQNKNVALQRIEDESERLEKLRGETDEQVRQATNDLTHEKSSLEENSSLLERIKSEQEQLSSRLENSQKELQQKQEARERLQTSVEKLEATYTALTESAAESRARLDSLTKSIEQDQNREATLKNRKTELLTKLEALSVQIAAQPKEQEFKESITAASKARQELELKIESIQEALSKSEDKQDLIKADLQNAKEERSKIEAELHVLNKLLEDTKSDFKTILDDTRAKPGFEKALSRALGDTLQAALDSDAQQYWVLRDINSMSLPSLPQPLSPLKPSIDAPQELSLALSQIGLVDRFEDGQSAMPDLHVGQSIVSKDGHYWRWDGFCMKADAMDRNAQYLEQKNRHSVLTAKLPSIQAQIDQLENSLEKHANNSEIARTNIEMLSEHKEEQRNIRTQAEKELVSVQNNLRTYKHDKEIQEAALRNIEHDLGDIEKSLRTSRLALESLQDAQNDEQQAHHQKIKEELLQAREKHQSAIVTFDMHKQTQKGREARLRALADERINLNNKIIRSKERIRVLTERLETQSQKLETLKKQPKNFEAEKQELLGAISTLDKARNEAAEKLAICESSVIETSKALKEAENTLSESKEKRAHIQATLGILKEQIEKIETDIKERFQISARELPKHAAIDVETLNIEELETQKQKREKLIRERESIGPVNLRAEEEMLELKKEAGTLLHEKNDLTQAIEELRNGIKTINTEAQARLQAAFAQVNAHFKRLFKRLFTGGEAHLALIDSDDPLEAGLEIFAQPPGKSLQSLSLLSGGEQTMASIALIFAMFLTNPSPICVLDEIDAPLDDANVDRVCDLIDEIGDRGETRFLIITHHRLSMARMDRLYGITMAERGVSQLVSVDLQQSFAFLDEAA